MEKKRQMISKWGLVSQGGSCEGGKVSTHSETPSWVEMGENPSKPQRRTLRQGLGRQTERIHHRDSCQTALPSQEAAYTFTMVSGGWVLRLGLQGSDPRERTRVDYHKDTLRGLIWHSGRSPGKSMGLPERQEMIAAGTLQLPALTNCQKLPLWMPEVGWTMAMNCQHQKQTPLFKVSAKVAGVPEV